MSLKSFVNNKDSWDAFLEELDSQIASLHRKLEQSEDVVEVYRAQGSIHSLQRLKMLRDKVNGQ